MQQIAMVLGCLCLAACGDPEQEFRVKVVNEDGRPMAGVDCQAGFYRASESGTGPRSYPVKGRTDASGQVELRGETCFFNSAVRTRAEGHYDCLVDKLWITGRSGDRWEPWPVEVELIMKRIIRPHPMHAIEAEGNGAFRFPNKELGPFGFDLVARDWVAPHGSGTVADFVLQAERTDPDAQSYNPTGKVKLTFSNPGDGILRAADHEGGSILVGPATAPEQGYLATWEFENRAGKVLPDGKRGWDFSRETYVFRIRTRLDEQGEVIAGQYGKIHGRIHGMLSPLAPRISVTYYLNAEPNERNLEWDMKNNLFSDLPRERWPKQP